MQKVSAFYPEKQKVKREFQESSNRWHFAVSIFREGFVQTVNDRRGMNGTRKIIREETGLVTMGWNHLWRNTPFLWKSSFLFIARRFSLLLLCLFQLAFDCTSLWQVPGAKTSSFLVVFFHLILISSFLLCSFPTIWSDFIHRHSLHTNSVRPSIPSENNRWID